MMAPKSKAQGKANAKAKATNVEPKKSSNAVDDAVAKAKAKASNRQLRKRDTDDETAKAVKDNFKEFSEAQLRLTLDGNGLNVYDRIHADKHAKRNGHDDSVAMGKYYYQSLKVDIFGHLDPLANMPLPPDKDTECLRLKAALKAVFAHSKSFVGVSAYLQTCEPLNMANLQALLRVVATVQPGGKDECNTRFLLEIMLFLNDGKYMDTQSATVSCLHGHFNDALCRGLSNYRSNEVEGEETATWWHDRKHVASLILPVDVVDHVLTCGLPACDMLAELQVVEQSSAVGATLVEKALRDGRSELFAKSIGALVQKWRLARITIEAVKENRAEFVALCNAAGKDPAENHGVKLRQVSYMGVLMQLPCESLLDAYNLHKEVVVRQEGVLQGLVNPLFSERDLAEDGLLASNHGIDEGLLKATTAARKHIHECMDGFELTGANIVMKLKEKFLFLMCKDPYFKIECQFFFDSVGKLGLDRAKAKMLTLLPSESRVLTTKESIGLFQTFQRSKLVEFAGLASRNLATIVCRFVQSIDVGAAPNFHGATDKDFFSAVKHALSFFLRGKIEGASAAKSLYGPAAFKSYLDDAKKQVAAKGGKVDKDVLLVLLKFVWAFSPEDAALVQSWRASSAASAGVVPVQPAASTGSASSSSAPLAVETAAAKAKAKKSAQLDAAVNSMFKRQKTM